MNSRERMIACLEHRIPDCVLYDLAGCHVTGIHRLAYQNLRRQLGMPETHAVLADTIQQIVLPDDDLLERLPHGSPEDVREDVKRNLEVLMPDGGFVFNTVHNIQAEVPPQNIMAMWEMLQEYGRY